MPKKKPNATPTVERRKPEELAEERIAQWKINPVGDKYRTETIKGNYGERTRILFLFIASQTSLVRPYIKDPELRRARERRETDGIKIVAW